MRKIVLLFSFSLAIISCKSPEARRPITHGSGSYIEEAVVRNKKLVAEEEQIIQEIMEQDSTENYLSSPNGFWYYYNRENPADSITPGYGDQVEFEYSLQTLDGEKIYPEESKIYSIDQEELFPGLREGIKLMKEGETVTFLFPSHQAYGFYGDKKKIGTNLPIRARVTLNQITSKNNNQNQN